LADRVFIFRPEARRIGRQTLVDQEQFSIDRAKLEFRVCDDDSFLRDVLSAARIDFETQLFHPIGDFVADPTLAAMEQMELYRALHPASPAAGRRPRLTSRGDLWIAQITAMPPGRVQMADVMLNDSALDTAISNNSGRHCLPLLVLTGSAKYSFSLRM